MKHLSLFILFICFCSCKTKELIYINGNREILVLDHSNTLKYETRNGCIGGFDRLYYIVKNDTLYIEKKTVPVGIKDVFNNGSVYGQKFKFSKDSLVNIDSRKTFYSLKIIGKREKQLTNKKLKMYVLFEGKKYKITKQNIKKSILSLIKSEDYNSITIDPEVAYNLYKIPQDYTTIQLTKK